MSTKLCTFLESVISKQFIGSYSVVQSCIWRMVLSALTVGICYSQVLKLSRGREIDVDPSTERAFCPKNTYFGPI